MNYLPSSANAFFDIFWKSFIVIIVYIPAVLYFNLSEDISTIIIELKEKYI